MKGKRIGRQTVQFSTPPVIRAAASVVGRKEGEGPLRDRFDSVSQDTYFGEKSWEQAESAMLRQCFARVCRKAALAPEALDYVLSGDLLNQCVGSAYAMRGVGAPYLGLYGACSTMAEAVSLAAMLIDGGCAETAAALTSSHFCSAERQYRFPLGYGGQRTPTAQWTATSYTGKTYTDVNKSDWFYNYVMELSEQGIVGGNGDGTFAPNRPTSTGEMLKLVLLSTGHKEQKPSTAHWASGYATYAYSMGFAAQNYSDYQLDNGISRLDVARFAAKALGYGASNTTSPFADVNDGYVTALYEAGVFIGTKIGDLTYFYPNSSITRAEVATIVYRIYQLSSLDQKQKIYYKDYTLDVLEGVPTNSYNKNAFVKNGSIMTYNDPSVRTRVGIDVSQYQGDVDWNAVARTDVDFVIARVGGRGYTVGAIYDDTKFDEYADGAARAGLQVGAYFFSQAVSVAEAQEEAYHVLDKLRGHEITGPVVFDWEVIGKSEARTYGIETGVLCAAANAFCKIIKDAGYDPMIYITDYAGYVKYDLSEVMDYPLWYARYDVDAPSFYYDFAMWQYSSKGSVDGIKGNVDMDIWFIK